MAVVAKAMATARAEWLLGKVCTKKSLFVLVFYQASVLVCSFVLCVYL